MAKPTTPGPVRPPLLQHFAGKTVGDYKSDQGVGPSAEMRGITLDRLIEYLQWLRTQDHQQVTWTYNGRFLDIHLKLSEFGHYGCDCASCEFRKAALEEYLRDRARARLRETAKREVEG